MPIKFNGIMVCGLRSLGLVGWDRVGGVRDTNELGLLD